MPRGNGLQQQVTFGNHQRTRECFFCRNRANQTVVYNQRNITIGALHAIGAKKATYIWGKWNILLNPDKDRMCDICVDQSLDDLLSNQPQTLTQTLEQNLAPRGGKRIITNMMALMKSAFVRKLMSKVFEEEKPHRIEPATINNKQCEEFINMKMDKLDGIAHFTLTKMAQHNISYNWAVKRIDRKARDDEKLIDIVVDRNDGDEEEEQKVCT